ncbi:hypothetical protein PSH61_01505 [Pseudomonas rhodesiae]|uniref:DUF7673 family protein n=1 Tax=Pseudomonas rhodesiae TaxID=76760 RepID=UPI00273294B3|nr:hypothetical protein [Pseudomonas rhodesiae]WLI29808.1 hypothetical protein PSH61_01505 [Pseudomonas rhodesiae]
MSDSLINALTQIWAYQRRRPAIIRSGTEALNRLIPVALSRTASGNAVGHFLLGLYDGATFRFDIKQLQRLSAQEFEDCLQVLEMDYIPEVEVHERVEEGETVWRELMEVWRTQPQEHLGGVPLRQPTRTCGATRSRAVNAKGMKAFDHLLQAAESSTGQGRIAGLFLMSLIHHNHYRLNLTDLRGLDLALFEACVDMLRMHYQANTEVQP